MASFWCLYLLLSCFLISLTQQQPMLSKKQQQQLKDDKLQRKISEQLRPLVDEYATYAFNNAMLDLMKKFEMDIGHLRDEIRNLSDQAAQVEEAMKNITRGQGVLQCPEVTGGYYYIVYNNNCFLFNDAKKTWHQAKQWCESKNAHLARPTSLDITEFLKNECRKRGKKYWIGSHDITNEATWVWDNDEPIPNSVTDWAPGEPNNWGGSQDCLVIGHGDQKKWDDSDCSHRQEFACQTKPVLQFGN